MYVRVSAWGILRRDWYRTTCLIQERNYRHNREVDKSSQKKLSEKNLRGVEVDERDSD